MKLGYHNVFFNSCSFADLQELQVELDRNACAAVGQNGQNGLIAVCDTLN